MNARREASLPSSSPGSIDEDALRREVVGLTRHFIADYDYVVKPPRNHDGYHSALMPALSTMMPPGLSPEDSFEIQRAERRHHETPAFVGGRVARQHPRGCRATCELFRR